MSAEDNSTSQIVTRSQTKKQIAESCVCPPLSPSHPSSIMDPTQKADLEELLNSLVTSLRQDMEKESYSQRTHLHSLKDLLETKLEHTGKKPVKSDLKPEVFAGTPSEDALDWFDMFERISKINNWSPESQLDAFPVYLSGIASAWFLTLEEEKKNDLAKLKTAFKQRFTSGPQNWLLSQQ